MLYAPRFPEVCLSDPHHDEGKTLEGTQAEMRVVDFLEYHTTSRIGNAAAIWQYGIVRQIVWRLAGSDKSNPQFCEVARASRACTNGKGARVFFMADQAAWVTKNSRICREVVKGKVRYIVTPKIAKVVGKTITLDNGDVVQADVVVCCTGYQQKFDWLQEDIGHTGCAQEMDLDEFGSKSKQDLNRLTNCLSTRDHKRKACSSCMFRPPVRAVLVQALHPGLLHGEAHRLRRLREAAPGRHPADWRDAGEAALPLPRGKNGATRRLRATRHARGQRRRRLLPHVAHSAEIRLIIELQWNRRF